MVANIESCMSDMIQGIGKRNGQYEMRDAGNAYIDKKFPILLSACFFILQQIRRSPSY